MSHENYRDCIEACEECANACDHCSTACLREKDVAALGRCISLDIDCAQMCRLASGAMARGSEMASQLCQLCADMCEACADECAKHKMDHCKQCADACRRCAAACRKMAGETRREGSHRGAHPAAH